MQFRLANNNDHHYSSRALLAIIFCLSYSLVGAQEPATPITNPVTDNATAPDAMTLTLETPTVELPTDEPEVPMISPCFTDGAGATSEKDKWIDKLHERLYAITCSPVSWFDGLFGNDRFDEEYQNTHGHVSLGTIWNQHGGFQRVTRVKARVYLPQLSGRFNAFVGRSNTDEVSTANERDQPEIQTPNAFGRNIEDSTLLGLGYNEPLKKHGSFDADVGVRVRAPPDPYAKASYRYALPLGERDLLRFRETIFWQQTERFGTTTRVDWDRVLADKLLLRWTGSGTFSESTEGMNWYSTLTLYEILNHQRALAYELKSYGASDHEIPVSNYGLTLIYRRSAWRDWLWVELRTGVDWPRDFVFQERRSNLNAALTFELRYSKGP